MDERKENGIQNEKESTVEVTNVENKEELLQEEIVSKNSKKKSNSTTIITLVAVLVVCLIAVLAYYFIWNNPKNIFLNAINSEYQTISNKLSKWTGENKISSDDVVTTTNKLTFDIKASKELQDPSMNQLLNELSKLNMTINTGMDRKKKELSTEILLNSNKDQLLNVGVYGTNKKMYIELKDLLNKFVELPMDEEYDRLFNDQQTSIDDLDYIMNETKDSFLKNLDKNDFKQTKETIKVDDKDVKTTKTSYELNDKTAKVLVEKIVKDLKENKKFVKKVASLTGEKESEIKEAMNDMIKEIKEDKTSSDNVVILSIYTKGMMNEAIAYEMNAKDKYSENNMRYTKGNTSTLVYTEDKEEAFHVTIKDEKNNKKKITLTADTVDMTMNVEDKGDTHKYVYTLTEKESDMKMYGTLNVNTKEVTKNKKYQQNMDFEMFMDVDSIKKALTFKVNTKGTTEVGKDLKIPEIKKSVTTNQLTEQDMTIIMTNLSKNTKLMEFVNTLNSLF